MSNSFSGPNCPISKALAVATFGMLFAPAAFADSWMRDEDGFPVATLEQKVEGYIEAEKIAVGCIEHTLFFERFSPAGSASSSLVRFRDGTEFSIEWNKVDGPNAMWAYGELASSIINKIRSKNMVSFQEGDREPVVFQYYSAPPIVDCR
jgi:hypothetical protein